MSTMPSCLLLYFWWELNWPANGDRPGLHNLLDFYFAAPRQALIDGALLIQATAARHPPDVHHISAVHAAGLDIGEEIRVEGHPVRRVHTLVVGAIRTLAGVLSFHQPSRRT